jgi:hypothetical protein
VKWPALLLATGLAAACSKPADVEQQSASTARVMATAPAPVPVPAAASATATAGECAAILQNVHAGRDIVVNVQCDTPTEAKLIAALANEKWEVLCPHVMPERGWLTKNNDIEINADIMPVPGSYWSQYGFRMSVVPFSLSQVDFAYVHALSWEDTQAQMPAVGRGMYENIQQITKLYPPAPAAMSRPAAELLLGDDTQPLAARDAELRKRIVDQINLRRELAYEDGSAIDTLKLPVFREGDAILTQVTLLPYVEPYPVWDKDNPHSALRLACSAHKDVPLRTFKSLCTLFLERQSMSAKTTNGEACESRRDGTPTTQS